jgi:OOP family OmpA-OmpF porin
MGNKTIIGLGLLAMILVGLICAARHSPLTPPGGIAATGSPETRIAEGGISSSAALPVFSARLDGGKVTLDGTVPDQASLDRILESAMASLGAGNFINSLKIAAPGSNYDWGADWTRKAAGWIPFAGRFGKKGEIAFDGRSVTVNGDVATADIRNRLMDEVRAVAGTSTSVNDNITVSESLLSEAESKAQSSLKELLLKGVEFDTGSDVIRRASVQMLDEAAAVLSKYPEVNIEISGHTDDRGASAMNQALSQRRAESVRKYLSGKGISAGRMTPKGYGQTQPVADNATEAGRARNRRIEFRVASKN